MRKLVGVLAIIFLVTLLTPNLVLAWQFQHPKKYGVVFTLGGSYLNMGDVNDYIPDQGFIDWAGSDEDDIQIGTQFGFGIAYRQEENFGWLFGYNMLASGVPVVFEQQYRRNAFFPTAGGAESWVEQKISGSEFYIMPTWYWGWGTKEIFFSIGPALYNAKMDRTISITRNAGAGANNAGSFSDASGSAVGGQIALGLELPISDHNYLDILVGGRLGNIGELTYEDNQGIENKVWLNSASNATFGVDFSGFFLNLALRMHFQPETDWRTPRE